MTTERVGLLLANIGTPASPSVADVKNYLREFLSDARVVRFPQWLWQPILRGFILPTRAKSSAKLYEKIWTAEGSPLLVHMRRLADELAKALDPALKAARDDSSSCDLSFSSVKIGMRYGAPSIGEALQEFRDENISHIVVLPLFPQYSTTTTASVSDAVSQALQTWPQQPKITFIDNYATHDAYITAIADTVTTRWKSRGKKHLLMSFHGIPQRYVDLGDPYDKQCHATAECLAKKLLLNRDEWDISFQSRLGPTPWLTPYTDKVLADMPSRKIYDVDVICPGFPLDCLETLEEIAMRGEEQFHAHGGKNFYYIPALNETPNHITSLRKILISNMEG